MINSYRAIHLKRLALIFLLFLNAFQLRSQGGVKINCLMPYEVDFAKNSDEAVINKRIEYVDHDDHTFWYKLNFESNTKFSYSISSLDDRDNFDVYFYQYNGANFCRSFIQNNLELISFDQKLELKAEKGSYYLGVFPLFPGGCGHKISFEYNDSYLELEVKNSRVKCGGDDIVLNPESVAQKAEVNISGFVKDNKTGNNINAQITLIDPFTAHQVKIFSSDKTGFNLGLLEDGDYKVRVRAFGYKDNITAISAYDGESYEFRLDASQEKNYVLNNVYFYPNTYALKDESKEELESIYSYLVNHPNYHIQIVGHTNGDKDVKASRIVREKGEEWNFNGTAKELSLRRASKIKGYLVDKGIDDIIIQVEGKGGKEMIVKDPSNMKEAMQNIRVEIIITSQG